MELNKLVKNRRSCRSFREAKVTKKDINAIIKTALLAPSWKNTETGRYYVALSNEAIAKVFDNLPDFNQNSTKNAAYIISCYKKGESGCGKAYEYRDKLKDSWGAYDLGLQNAYLMLKASDLGYDTLVLGLRNEKELRKYFNIPDDQIMMPVIAIGKKSRKLSLNTRKSLDEVLKVY